MLLLNPNFIIPKFILNNNFAKKKLKYVPCYVLLTQLYPFHCCYFKSGKS